MEAIARPRIKICCISSADEASCAVAAGADAIGLVSAMPSGPGVIDDLTIRAIATCVPPPVATFLLISGQDASGIVAQVRASGTGVVQLCDRLVRGTHADLRAALPGLRIVQVIHVLGEESVAEALAVAPAVDALLLDSGNPSLAVKQLGGTGRCHDWRWSRLIRERSPVPVFLAGGLRPDNVAQAIAEVGPFGLDVCSGVRTEGRLDPDKLAAFLCAVGRT
jgi:phosphoribosylanthranilate isomerase